MASNKEEKVSRKNIKELRGRRSCSTDEMFGEFQKITKKISL